MSDLFRIYEEVGEDGYPREWHHGHRNDALGIAIPAIKDLVREQTGHRCVRCGHPYRAGTHGNGEWSPCDRACHHGGPVRIEGTLLEVAAPEAIVERAGADYAVEAQWRILTVHHLNGVKADCRWWNLAALCQRCHLRIQRVVLMGRVFPYEHSAWFKPYAAGWYAWAYLGEDLTREQVDARLEELLALERQA